VSKTFSLIVSDCKQRGDKRVVQFIYDGDELAGEYNRAGAMATRYVHGPGEDDPIVWYSGATMDSTTRRFLHEDHSFCMKITAAQ
jgi:hypothetical protein